MGLLDDLEIPHTGVKRRVIEKEHFITTAHTRLRDVFLFLTAYVHELKTNPPVIKTSYMLEGFGEMLDLPQGNYKLHTPEDNKNISEVLFSFVCERDGEIVFKAEGSKLLFEHKSEFLRSNGLKFTFEELFKEVWGRTKSDHLQGAFYVKFFVPVSFRFSVDEKSERILLTIKNLNGIGEERMPLKPEVLTQKFISELILAARRKPNQMNELAGFKVQDNVRQQLQERLRKDAAIKQQQLGITDTKVEKKPGLFDKMLGKIRKP